MFITKRRRVILTIAQLLVVISLSVLAGRVLNHHFFARQERVGGPIPYTVVLQQTLHRSDGSTSNTMETTEAIRSDGSRMLARKSLVNPTLSVERILNFASGNQVTISELTSLKSMEASNVNLAILQRDPSSKCVNSFAGYLPLSNLVKEVFHDEELVAGYRTIKLSASDGITQWFAIDYGCAVIKRKWDWGVGKGFSEDNLVTLIPGEPDSVLFSIPANAKEVSHYERIKATLEASRKNDSCGTCADNFDKAIRKRDESYYLHRPR